MDKIAVFVVVMIVFSVLGALLDEALGITFPNMASTIIHTAFYIIYGAILGAVMNFTG